jgi:restriction system protein
VVVAEIDRDEGVLTILQLVAERGPGKRSDFLPDYLAYCRAFTSNRSETVIKGSLYDRLVNLVDRGYVIRRGQTYEIADAGLSYLDTYAHLVPGRTIGSKQSELRRLATDMSREARDQLADYLAAMDPFKFEALIKFLLEEMGYTEVETTSPTNDRGVDVVANIDLGISSVREVVQVKRHRGNINRTILDQLRGSLHRFNAVRGTIITTGGFSRGTVEAAFERGAAPITLIDGEKLLDLLTQHEVGVTKKVAEYIEFDAGKLVQFEPEEAEEPAV